MIIENLKWDSDFFGLKVGRLTILDNSVFNLDDFLKKVKDDDYDLVYVISYDKMLQNQSLLKANLNLVDIQMTMSLRFNSNNYITNPYEFRTELNEKELIECYAIAESTSKVSRFYTELSIGTEKTKELYRKWIDNAINKSFSDGLFLEKLNDKVVGIHLIKTDENNDKGYFTLTGVDETIKRMGLGTKLWNQSFGYLANEKKITEVKSPFSFQNKESFNFHLKRGFNKVDEIKYIYHYNK
ncbi:GNAT family N-acetyltransferase [Winogradskyella sp. PC D3.3]